ncbi:MAG TPA: phosphoglycerate mutase family protein [Acidimicrobiales bacterium]|nr:phosphoglycerate mutase family protein [Acidimicrobiales bacterium]
MRVVVVRHGCAGDKREWTGPDADRPLDDAGRRQADAITAALEHAGIHRILTSPTVRCRDTVAPLARALALPVEDGRELAVGGSDSGLFPVIRRPDVADAVLCTHGELMAPLLAAIRRVHARIHAVRDDDAWLLEKGTAWDLTVVPTGSVTALRHIVPEALVACAAHPGEPARR